MSSLVGKPAVTKLTKTASFLAALAANVALIWSVIVCEMLLEVRSGEFVTVVVVEYCEVRGRVYKTESLCGT